MFDQLLSSIKDKALGAVTNNEEIPNEKIDDILKIAGDVTQKEVVKETSNSGLGSIMNLFSSSDNNSGANLLQGNIMSGVIAGIIEKTGLNPAAAKTAASSVVPMLMSKITDKNNETDENDSSPLNDVFGMLGGGSAGDIMGKIGGFFGK